VEWNPQLSGLLAVPEWAGHDTPTRLTLELLVRRYGIGIARPTRGSPTSPVTTARSDQVKDAFSAQTRAASPCLITVQITSADTIMIRMAPTG
jgi:hypothetical protein